MKYPMKRQFLWDFSDEFLKLKDTGIYSEAEWKRLYDGFNKMLGDPEGTQRSRG